jgi:hypothetical protein
MNETVRSLAARLAIVSLSFSLVPMSALASETGARVEGLVIDADGEASAGATVYLFDARGETRVTSAVSDGGRYSLRDVPPGEYGMGLRTVDGTVAPVSAPPVRVARGELVRRDLKLVQADPAAFDRALVANPSFGSWFHGLGGGEKAGLIIGFVAFAGLLYKAFDDDDDTTEQPSSPM